jgi:hypothetical protein
MAELAKGPFWLDGGYDRESVEACPHHPDHDWWEFRLGDVIEPDRLRDPDNRMVICRGCYVPRCGHTNDPDPCMLPRHHREPHRLESGRAEPISGSWQSHAEAE